MFRSRLFIITLLFSVLLGACKQAPKDKDKKPLVAADAEPILISAKQQDASCVYLTQDETSTPIMSWVEVDSTTQKNLFTLLDSMLSSMPLEHRSLSPSRRIPAYMRKECLRLL